jgi:hypothetical protein
MAAGSIHKSLGSPCPDDVKWNPHSSAVTTESSFVVMSRLAMSQNRLLSHGIVPV